MKSVNRAKLDLIIAVTAFGTIGIFVRYINLPSSVIAFVPSPGVSACSVTVTPVTFPS